MSLPVADPQFWIVTAAAAVALAQGESAVSAAGFAARVGAYVVGHHEVIPALPTTAQLEGVSA